jgi:hydrogenase/urease accessory protein HupE
VRQFSLRAIVLGVLAALAPSAALAHVGVQTTDLVAGAIRPWINLESGLTLGGVTLWMTQDAPARDIEPFIGSGVCLSAGVLAGCWLKHPAPPWLIYLPALTVGSCVSLNVAPVNLVRLAGVGVVALLAGYVAGVDTAQDVKAPLFFAAGGLAGGLIIPLGFAALFADRGFRSLRIGMRILGSWIAAVSLMLLALRRRA